MKAKVTDDKKEPAPTAPTKVDQSEAVAAMSAVNQVESPEDSIPVDFNISAVKPLAVAREEAKIPEHKKASQLLGREIVFVSWRPQQGLLASTGEYRPGFFCVCMDVETKKVFTVWIGQVALLKELRKLKPPFRATINQSGRTLVFA